MLSTILVCLAVAGTAAETAPTPRAPAETEAAVDAATIGAAGAVGATAAFHVTSVVALGAVFCLGNCPVVGPAVQGLVQSGQGWVLLLAPSAAAIVVGAIADVIAGFVVDDPGTGLAIAGLGVVFGVVGLVIPLVIAAVAGAVAYGGLVLVATNFSSGDERLAAAGLIGGMVGLIGGVIGTYAATHVVATGANPVAAMVVASAGGVE